MCTSSQSLARLGANTTAIDAAAQNITMAQTHAALDPSLHVINSPIPSRGSRRAKSTSRNTLEYRHCAAEDLVREGKRFDVVCAMEVVEHVEDPRGFLECLMQLTKVRCRSKTSSCCKHAHVGHPSRSLAATSSCPPSPAPLSPASSPSPSQRTSSDSSRPARTRTTSTSSRKSLPTSSPRRDGSGSSRGGARTTPLRASGGCSGWERQAGLGSSSTTLPASGDHCSEHALVGAVPCLFARLSSVWPGFCLIERTSGE